MRTFATLMATLLTVACAGPTSASASPSTPASPAASATPEASPTPAPPSPTVSKLTFSCRLPVTDLASSANYFLDFPSLDLSPAGRGKRWYDPVVRRWLPVGPHAISPDGTRYAFIEGWAADAGNGPRVHVVDAATDKDLLVYAMADPYPFAVIQFNATSLYLGIRYEGTAPGVWKLALPGGAVTKISETLYPPDAAWFGVIDLRDDNPYRFEFDGTPAPNRLDHRYANGVVTTWLFLGQHALVWVPFADGRAVLVQATWKGKDPSDHQVGYWVMTGPKNRANLVAANSSSEVNESSDISDGMHVAAADSHGIWIGGERSLHLATHDGVEAQFLTVYGRSLYPAGTCD